MDCIPTSYNGTHVSLGVLFVSTRVFLFPNIYPAFKTNQPSKAAHQGSIHCQWVRFFFKKINNKGKRADGIHENVPHFCCSWDSLCHSFICTSTSFSIYRSSVAILWIMVYVGLLQGQKRLTKTKSQKNSTFVLLSWPSFALQSKQTYNNRIGL